MTLLTWPATKYFLIILKLNSLAGLVFWLCTANCERTLSLWIQTSSFLISYLKMISCNSWSTEIPSCLVSVMVMITIFNWFYNSTMQSELFARKKSWLYFAFRPKRKILRKIQFHELYSVAIFHQRKYICVLCFCDICFKYLLLSGNTVPIFKSYEYALWMTDGILIFVIYDTC